MDHKNNISFTMRKRRSSILQITIFVMVILMILLQNINVKVEAKVLQTSKKTLKLLKSSPSLIQLRHKRDTFVAERQQQQQPSSDDEFFDENYDVIPDMSGGAPPSIGDQISERAKQVAESFSNMWKSLTESVKHCVDALRGLFAGEEYELTPEQEEQIRIAMEQERQAKNMHNNEDLMYAYENQV